MNVYNAASRIRLPTSFIKNRNEIAMKSCPHTCKLLLLYFVVSCICAIFAEGNHLKWR